MEGGVCKGARGTEAYKGRETGLGDAGCEGDVRKKRAILKGRRD